MTEHELLMEALRSAAGLCPEQAAAAKLIDDRRSAEAIAILERLAARDHARGTAPHPGALPDPLDALDDSSDVTVGIAAASLAATLSRTEGSALTEVFDQLWEEIARAPRLAGRAADRLLLQVVLTRCYDARHAALPAPGMDRAA